MDWYWHGRNCSEENSTFTISKIETSSKPACWCVIYAKRAFVSKLLSDHMRFGRRRNHKIKNWKNIEPRRTKISNLSYLWMRSRYVRFFLLADFQTEPLATLWWFNTSSGLVISNIIIWWEVMFGFQPSKQYIETHAKYCFLGWKSVFLLKIWFYFYSLLHTQLSFFSLHGSNQIRNNVIIFHESIW